MIYYTIAKEFFIGYCHPIRYISSLEIPVKPKEPCLCFYLLNQGTCTINHNKANYSLSAPALLCMNEMDEYIFTDTCDIQMAVLYFHPGIISPCFNFQNIRVTEKESFDDVQLQDLYLLYPFLHRNTDNNGLLKLGEDTFTRVHKLVELIGRELTLQKDNAWPCRSRSYFLELLILITKIYESNQKVSDVMLTEATEDITVVLNYLNNNYQEKITLQQLSEMFATNRTSLNNRFYKATNLSVIDYLINLRIQVAAAMLRDTQLPISEIMIRVGFNNSTHFWRTFKKYHSLSPKEYRDQYCWVKA